MRKKCIWIVYIFSHVYAFGGNIHFLTNRIRVRLWLMVHNSWPRLKNSWEMQYIYHNSKNTSLIQTKFQSYFITKVNGTIRYLHIKSYWNRTRDRGVKGHLKSQLNLLNSLETSTICLEQKMEVIEGKCQQSKMKRKKEKKSSRTH